MQDAMTRRKWWRLNFVNGFGDPIYAILTYALVVFGLAVQLSVTFHTDGYKAVGSQLVYVVIGTVLMVILSMISYQALNLSMLVELFSTAMAMSLLLVCVVTGLRAVRIAGVFIQPSEIAKFSVILSATFCFGQRARDLCSMLAIKAQQRRFFRWFHPTEKGLQFYFLLKCIVYAVLTAAESHLSGFLIIIFLTYAILIFMKYQFHFPYFKKMRVRTGKFTPDGREIHQIRYVIRYKRLKHAVKVVTALALVLLSVVLVVFYRATRVVKADRAAWQEQRTAYSALSDEEKEGVQRPRSADEQNLHEQDLYDELLRHVPLISGYQKARIYSWMDRGLSPNDVRLQQTQTIYAIASGGLAGKGYLNSLQKYSWVTQAENDMVFSIICEETGIWGAALLMLLFVLLTWRGMRIAGYFRSRNTCIIPFAVSFHIALQAILNIAVCLEFIPNTGVSLPFISQGGSSIIMLLCEVGMVLSVSSDARIDLLGRPIRASKTKKTKTVRTPVVTEDQAS